MKLKNGWMLVPALMLGLFLTALLPGCSVGDPNDVTTVANGSFSGNYVGTQNGVLVAHNTGNPITSLTVSQSGNQLQAVDNNGILFKGTIGDILGNGGTSNASSSSATATFTLTGATTAGQSVTITGNFKASGSTATMTGLWVEPTLYSSFSGVASITPVSTSTPTQTATISVVANPSNEGTVSGGGTFTVGASVTLTANAAAGFTFTNWNDAVTSNPRTITVPTGGATFTANFH
jgi:hypothetical protein